MPTSPSDLSELKSAESIACVPVGLTKYRQNLPELIPFNKTSAAEVIAITEKYENVFAADELYLTAELPIPEYEYYGTFPQYENGVGMWAYFKDGFGVAIKDFNKKNASSVSVVTGTAAFRLMKELLKDFTNVKVYAIRNCFFGESVTVSGLVTGGDIVTQLKDEDLTIFRRRHIGFIFQNYNLVPILNVYENIVLPIELDGKKPDDALIGSVMRLLKLEQKLYDMPNNLSGGQQQRVAIARALAGKPSIILADEPTGNLDSHTSSEVIDLLKLTSKEFNQTIVMITHNPEIAELADRTIRIEDGRIAG